MGVVFWGLSKAIIPHDSPWLWPEIEPYSCCSLPVHTTPCQHLEMNTLDCVSTGYRSRNMTQQDQQLSPTSALRGCPAIRGWPPPVADPKVRRTDH